MCRKAFLPAFVTKRCAQRILANGEQETRDEIVFLLLHQGFADRFFPGTSVLHTRLRYALFVPWVYQTAASKKRAGKEMQRRVEGEFLRLARRLKIDGHQKTGVIGGEVVRENRLTSQPPDTVYWSALRAWGILLDGVDSRSDAFRRLEAVARGGTRDESGDILEGEDFGEAFCGLPDPPKEWKQEAGPLTFDLEPREGQRLRQLLRQVRNNTGELSLLAKLSLKPISLYWSAFLRMFS